MEKLSTIPISIENLNTPEECIAFADECIRLVGEARRKAVELRAAKYLEKHSTPSSI